MPFDLIILDLDNTLYAADRGVFERMDQRMTSFMMQALELNEEQANHLRVAYWKQYGTTLKGLMLHHGIEPEGFLAEVHDIKPEELLNNDPELDKALARLPGRKVIHTNGTREHAERVLNALGIRHHIDGIYDIRFNNYTPKPSKSTLASIIEQEGASPQRTLVVDDMPENLRVAKELGCKTVWISRNPHDGHWDFHLFRPHELATWVDAQRNQQDRY